MKQQIDCQKIMRFSIAYFLYLFFYTLLSLFTEIYYILTPVLSQRSFSLEIKYNKKIRCTRLSYYEDCLIVFIQAGTGVILDEEMTVASLDGKRVLVQSLSEFKGEATATIFVALYLYNEKITQLVDVFVDIERQAQVA